MYKLPIKFPINDGAITATEKTTDSGIKNEMAISEIAITNWDKISFKQKYTKIIINQDYSIVFALKNAARCIGG